MTDFPQKIMIFGRPGSGKSTFALKIHQQTQIPLYHLDKFFFTSNWVERDYNEFLATQQMIVDKTKWIIDGNSTKSLEMRYQQADLSLYFNYPLYLYYWRVLKRLFTKNLAIDDRAEGCDEVLKVSLLKYIWGFDKRVENQIIELRKKYPLTKFIEINSDQKLMQFYKEFYKLL